MNAIYQPMIEKLRGLRLGAFADHFMFLYDKDPENAAQMFEHLDKMVDDEIAARSERTIRRRIKEAQFVRIQTVDTFDFNYNAATKRLKKRYLKLIDADVVEQGVGSVFMGPSGLGKTHLARALGYATCQKERSVLFRPCSTILNDLVTAEATKNLASQVKKLVSPALLTNPLS